MFAYSPWKFSKAGQFEILSVVVRKNLYKTEVCEKGGVGGGRERERDLAKYIVLRTDQIAFGGNPVSADHYTAPAVYA